MIKPFGFKGMVTLRKAKLYDVYKQEKQTSTTRDRNTKISIINQMKKAILIQKDRNTTRNNIKTCINHI